MAYTRQVNKRCIGWQILQKGVVPAPGTNSLFRVFDLELNLEGADRIEQSWAAGREFPEASQIGGRFATLSFATEIRGSHTADVIPPEGVWFRAAGFDENSSGSTPLIKFTYIHGDLHLASGTPAGNLDPMYSCVVYTDRLKYTLTNLVGNVILEFVAGRHPIARFSLRGYVSGITSTASGETEADPGESFVAGSSPIPCQNFGLTINSVANLVVRSIVYDCGNVIDNRDNVNGTWGFGQPILLPGAPKATIELEAPDLDDIDFKDLYITRTAIPVSFVHNNGGAVRQECTVTFTGYIDEMPEYFDDGGKLMMRIVLSQNPSTGPLTLAWD